MSADAEGTLRARNLLCWLLTAGVLLAAFLGVCGARTAIAAESLVGKKAPEFTRRDLKGKRVDLGRLRGKVVLLNFWATWCAPCQVEMPAFVEWQRQYRSQGFRVVGISMDDDVAPVRSLAAKLRVNYPVSMGDEELGELYGGVLGLPLTYLIDRDGVVRARFQGESDLNAIETQVQALLGQR